MNDASEETEYATIYVKHEDVSDGTEDADMHFRAIGAGSLASRLVLGGNSRISLGNNDSGGDTTNTIFGYTSGNSITSGGIKNTLFGKSTGKSISSKSNHYWR